MRFFLENPPSFLKVNLENYSENLDYTNAKKKLFFGYSDGCGNDNDNTYIHNMQSWISLINSV